VGRKSLAKERRIQIAEALYRCICKYGLPKSTIKKIAEEAGVKYGILHHYFKDRDEIIEELVDKFVDDLSTSYREELQKHRNPKTRFSKGIDLLFGPEMIGEDQSCFFYNCWAEAKRNPKISEAFTRLYGRYREGVLELLVETGMTSDLSSKEAEDLASMIVAMQDGVDLQWDMDRKRVDLKRMSRLIKDLIELYLENKRRLKDS